MPNLLLFEPGQILGFFIIFTRISGLMVAAPVLGDNNIPMQVKVGLAFVMSLVFYPVLAAPTLGNNPPLLDISLLTLREFATGALMGFSVRILFTGLAMAGEVIGFQMGVGIANIFDPSSQTQVALIGQIYMVFALLLFVVLDGHHLLVQALVESYRILPVGEASATAGGAKFFTTISAEIFIIGLKIGAPLIVAMMAANMIMGLITRSVPQLNVIIVGIPFTILMGLAFLAIGFPFFIRALMVLNARVGEVILTAAKLLN